MYTYCYVIYSFCYIIFFYYVTCSFVILSTLIVMYVPFCVFCVLSVCKCALDYCHGKSSQLQLKIIHTYCRISKVGNIDRIIKLCLCVGLVFSCSTLG
jgi:hypothetical protein